MSPFSGFLPRKRRSRSRNPSHSCVSSASTGRTYRPAVSRMTASSENHQSQLRVPPTPRTGERLRAGSRYGKFSPEFCSSVVFPVAGGPMIMYQGRT